MPLHTQIIRDGEPLKVRWSEFHVAAMVMAAAIDSARGPWEDMDSFLDEARDLMERNGCIGIDASTAFNLADYSRIGATPLSEGAYAIQNISPLVFHDNTGGIEDPFEIRLGDELIAIRRSH